MKICCISASNIKHARQNSTSLRVCNLIKKIIEQEYLEELLVDIIPLVEYEFKPCIGCGKCHKVDACVFDQHFNEIYSKLSNADALFIVSAHYAPIPAKLSMVLEKIEQLTFIKRFNDESYRSPLFKKPVGIIGHGGGTEEISKYYRGPILDAICNALSYPIEMDIVGVDEEQPNGIIIPVKRVKKIEGSIFPIQEYDWKDIEERVSPLIKNVISKS
jgi:NAD(P)H-dependent FMN reductase